jgi:hypothetical protein
MLSVVEGHAHGARLLEVICGHLKVFGKSSKDILREYGLGN